MSLPLDKRWTLTERREYDRLLRAGHFSASNEILKRRLTAEQWTQVEKKAAEYSELFGAARPAG